MEEEEGRKGVMKGREVSGKGGGRARKESWKEGRTTRGHARRGKGEKGSMEGGGRTIKVHGRSG